MASMSNSFLRFVCVAGCVVPLTACNYIPKRWTVWKPPAIARPELAEQEPYRVAAGDVLRLEFPGEPQALVAPVDIDGRIHIDDRTPIDVDGRTIQEIESLLSIYRPARVEVADYASQVVHLSGVFGKGAPKAVGYQGPETVQQLIARVGCKECIHGYRVRVVRAGAKVGGQPEIFSLEFDEDGVNRNPNEQPLYLRPGDYVYVEKNVGRMGPMTLLTDPRFRAHPTTWLKQLRFAQSSGPMTK